MGKRKDGNQEGDVVLIHYQDKPMAYARIEAIKPDVKKDWHHVTLLLLTIPLQAVTWILRQAYVDGEPFTMGGQPVRLEKVERQNTVDRRATVSRGRESEDKSQETGDAGKETGRPENRQPSGQTVKVIPFKRENIDGWRKP
jgi:hypothetical protein